MIWSMGDPGSLLVAGGASVVDPVEAGGAVDDASAWAVVVIRLGGAVAEGPAVRQPESIDISAPKATIRLMRMQNGRLDAYQ